MRKYAVFLLAFGLLAAFPAARATIFGTIRGIVHDPQHRPIAGAEVKLQSATSDFSLMAQTNQDGEFTFNPVAVGDYVITVSRPGFAITKQNVTVISDSSPILHFPLDLATVNQTETVTANSEIANIDSATPTTLIDRQDIADTPGADRTNSLQMITDYVPGAYVTHDQLHIRGGHQVSWLIDGVPIPNTNIASNVGPQIDPKDIDYLETQRGSYDAAYGDRTYGVFDVVPRTGFERNNDAELVTSFGNWYQTNDQINFGGHTERFAYFASLNGNRSNYGLADAHRPGFPRRRERLRRFRVLHLQLESPRINSALVTSLRRDYYQIPYDPDPNADFVSSGLRDAQQESDALRRFLLGPHHQFQSRSHRFALLSLQHAPTTKARPTTSRSAPPTNARSNYGGAQATLNVHFSQNDAQAGFYGFGQHDNQLFGLLFNDGSSTNFQSLERPTGGLESAIRRRQIQSHLLAHSDGRRPLHSFFRRVIGRRHRPALRRRVPNPASQLGLPRLLRKVLPGPAAAHGVRPAARFRHQPESWALFPCTVSATKKASSV